MKVLLFANTDWYLYNFRLSLAQALQREGNEVLMVSPPGPYVERIRAFGFRWVPVDMRRRSLNVFRELRLLWDLVKIYRTERPDLVHHFTLKPVVYGSVAADVAGVQRRVNAVTGLGYVFTNVSLLARALRPVLKSALGFVLNRGTTRVVVQNGDDVAAIVGAGLARRENVRLIPGSGVNTARFRPRARTRDGDTVRVLLATRLLWDKGVGEYVEAARIVRGVSPEVEFWMAGASDMGNPAAVSVEDVEAWRREGIVTVLGHVEDMADLLADVDLVCLPSYREGLPRTVIEAAAAGLPVITTDAPGCRDAVENGVTGLVVPVGDAHALAGAIMRACGDRELRKELGRAGRRRALLEFDERIVIKRTFDVYRELGMSVS